MPSLARDAGDRQPNTRQAAGQTVRMYDIDDAVIIRITRAFITYKVLILMVVLIVVVLESASRETSAHTHQTAEACSWC